MFSLFQIGISILKVLLQITRPKTVMLGNIPGTGIYRNLDHYKEAMSVAGFLILSIEAPINFANATYLKERLVPELPCIAFFFLPYLFIEFICQQKDFKMDTRL